MEGLKEDKEEREREEKERNRARHVVQGREIVLVTFSSILHD